MNESMFDVPGPDGFTRRAILTEAAEPGDTVVVLLPSGFKHRVGSHRLNVRLARHLAGLGYTTLRYDPAGFGESDGTLANVPYGTLGTELEKGYFVEDVLLAVRAVRERLGAQRVVLGGLCGGGVTATLTAAADTAGIVQGVLSVGLPVLTLGHPDIRRMPRADVARKRLRNYAQKLLSPAAWWRVLKGHSDFGNISRNLRGALNLPVKPGAGGKAAPAQENPHFLASFDRLRERGVPQLFVYGTSDNRWLEFEQTFFARALGRQPTGPGYTVARVPEGSHEVHFEPAKQQTVDAVADWLVAHVPPRSTP